MSPPAQRGGRRRNQSHPGEADGRPAEPPSIAPPLPDGATAKPAGEEGVSRGEPGPAPLPAVSPLRIGSVAYLNALPLTCGLEEQVLFTTPARLAALLRQGQLEVALVSITEALFQDSYVVLDGVAIASCGPVKSVLLAHRLPLEAVREVHCDPASLSSVALLRVLLAERGLQPAFVPLRDYGAAPDHDAVLLIGDRALDFTLRVTEHQIWDLGEAWYERFGLPFVHAAWIARREGPGVGLGSELRAARDRGLARLESLIRARTDYTLEFRRHYLTENVRFDLGEAEKRGIERFVERLRRHGLTPVFEPQFVT